MKPKAILFDLDGTLIDSFPAIIESFKEIMLRHGDGLEVSSDKVAQYIGKPLEDVMLEVTGDIKKAEQLVKEYRDHNKSLLPKIPFFPGIVDMFEQLQETGVKLGVVTSKSRESTMVTIKAHDAEKYFDSIITYNDVDKHKPLPDPLIKACEELGVDCRESVYIGDSTYDIQSAKAAGCLSVAALWCTFDRELLLAENPDHAFGTVIELSHFLQKSII